MTTKKFLRNKHIFRFKIKDVDGKARVVEIPCKVKAATREVTLTLEASHVKRSIALRGAGNTQTCSMAVCAKAQPDVWPHPIDGYIDWQMSRAYVVSKVRNGLPVECVVYVHNDNIAWVNDTPGGQRKLLAELQRTGSRSINLYPVWKKSHTSKTPGSSAKSKGIRKPRVHTLRGAQLRFAVAQLGGV